MVDMNKFLCGLSQNANFKRDDMRASDIDERV